MLPKRNAYVKSYDRQTKQLFFFFIEEDDLKNIILFGTRSLLISKRNLIASLSKIITLYFGNFEKDITSQMENARKESVLCFLKSMFTTH